MKKYKTPELEIIRFEMKDIISASAEEENPTAATNGVNAGGGPGMPGHGDTGNQDACC